MARPKKSGSPTYTSSQAVFILEKAIADRKISSADLDGYLSAMKDEITTIEERLSRLKDAVVQPVMKVVHQIEEKVKGGDGPFPAPVKKRKKPMSAKRKASMKLQGEYMGLLGALSKKDKVTFKALAKNEGREKAIAEMKKAKK